MAKKSSYNWLIERLDGDSEIDSTYVDSDNILHINRVIGEPLRIITSALDRFNYEDIKPLADLDNVDFILHILKEPYISGNVFEYLDSKQKVLGGYGDVFRILNQSNNYPYLPPEVRFIKRGLEQHTKVNKVRRLDDRRYEIVRYGLETVIIVALNEYDLSVEAIRSAIDKYKTFDAVLKSNPNGRISASALKLSDSKEIKVFKWGELLGKLNQEWTWKT